MFWSGTLQPSRKTGGGGRSDEVQGKTTRWPAFVFSNSISSIFFGFYFWANPHTGQTLSLHHTVHGWSCFWMRFLLHEVPSGSGWSSFYVPRRRTCTRGWSSIMLLRRMPGAPAGREAPMPPVLYKTKARKRRKQKCLLTIALNYVTPYATRRFVCKNKTVFAASHKTKLVFADYAK